MNAIERQLRDFMVDHDVPPDEAERAAAECARRIRSDAKVGAVAGLAVGLTTANPGTLIMGVAVGAGFGAAAAIGSPSCQQVREAAFSLARVTAH